MTQRAKDVVRTADTVIASNLYQEFLRKDGTLPPEDAEVEPPGDGEAATDGGGASVAASSEDGTVLERPDGTRQTLVRSSMGRQVEMAKAAFETVVEFVADLATGEVLACGYHDEAETLERFAEGATGTAVLMGDPNHSGYQFVGKVQRAVDRPVRVVPGISSLQVAASRARTPMEDAEFVTLHKSGDLAPDRERLREHVGDRHLLVLPRPYDLMPGDVAAELLDAGADGSLSALVLERLTHDDESVARTTLGELAGHAGGSDPDDSPFSDLSVQVVRAG